jgi:hypothetical protein
LTNQDRFEFEEEALEAVQRGRAWGALYFSPNYSRSLEERLRDPRFASELTVNESNVLVQMDMSSEYAGIHFTLIEHTVSVHTFLNKYEDRSSNYVILGQM